MSLWCCWVSTWVCKRWGLVEGSLGPWMRMPFKNVLGLLFLPLLCFLSIMRLIVLLYHSAGGTLVVIVCRSASWPWSGQASRHGMKPLRHESNEPFFFLCCLPVTFCHSDRKLHKGNWNKMKTSTTYYKCLNIWNLTIYENTQFSYVLECLAYHDFHTNITYSPQKSTLKIF